VRFPHQAFDRGVRPEACALIGEAVGAEEASSRGEDGLANEALRFPGSPPCPVVPAWDLPAPVLTTLCMVSRRPSLTSSGPVPLRGGAGRESSRPAVKLIRSWGPFLAGDQAGDRGQDRVEVLASAEVT
jgi:hypothetical protein